MNRVNLLDNRITLINGDCLEILPKVKPACVDMIFADLPYGTTACEWDSVLPLDTYWNLIKRCGKPQIAYVHTANKQFSYVLGASNLAMLKYEWVWVKSRALGFTNAKLKPMNRHELVLVFSDGVTANGSTNQMRYYPQDLIPYNKIVNGIKETRKGTQRHGRPSQKAEHLQEFTNYPDTILAFANPGSTVHPTQKPVELLEYLIKTYTSENDVVLDPTAGSFTTAVACINTNRRCIAIEKDAGYFQIGVKRCEEAINARQ